MRPRKTMGDDHQHARKRVFRIHRKAKLRETVGVVDVKQSLNIGLLNVDGFSEQAKWDIDNTMGRKNLDICVLLETKRRREEIPLAVDIEGYDTLECRRSDGAGDKAGGGILLYTKNTNGLAFKEYKPKILNPEHGFVNNERMWVTIDSLKQKISQI